MWRKVIAATLLPYVLALGVVLFLVLYNILLKYVSYV